MNKHELVTAVAEGLGGRLTAQDVHAVTDAIFSTIVRETTKGNRVTVTGFGVFEKRRRSPRTARNPRTGEAVRVKATSVPAFRPSANYKDAVARKVKLEKTGSVIGRTSSAKAAAAAPVKAAPAKKAAAKPAPAKKEVATKPVAAKKAAPAKKAVAAKPVAAKKVAVAVKKAAVKPVAAKKVAAAVKPAPVKKAPAKKAPAKKAAPKKAR